MGGAGSGRGSGGTRLGAGRPRVRERAHRTLSIALWRDLADRLDRAVERSGLSRSAWIARAIADRLERDARPPRSRKRHSIGRLPPRAAGIARSRTPRQ